MQAHRDTKTINVLHIMQLQSGSNHPFYVHGSFCVVMMIIHVDKLYRMLYLTKEVKSGQLAS